MKIKNITKKTLLSEHMIVASKFREKTLGLLTYKTAQAMLFHTRFGIHTYGMKYPVDVLVLNSNNKVVAIKRHLKPNNLFLWNPRYNTVIELPEGSINQTHTELTDEILIV